MTTMRHFLGVEIGGTKLQLAVGSGDGTPLRGLWRAAIDAPAGAGRIQQQIVAGVDELLAQTRQTQAEIAGVGVGFGGPVDSTGGRIVVSNQVAGWDDFPLGRWVQETFGWPCALHNDADTAALAEARFGAGRGFDPVMYVTVGSGIGGGLVIGGRIYRGQGAGAMEIGHLRPPQTGLRISLPAPSVEAVASGFGIENRARETTSNAAAALSTRQIAEAAANGDAHCRDMLADATDTLGWALAQAATLINPARIVIGGGVSLMGEERFFLPVRRAFGAAVFQPFAGLAEIVPAGLGEEVVLFGALALARDQLLS